MATVNSLLAPGAVDLHGAANDWRKAIRLAGALLEKTGTITSDYTESMIQSVEDNGPYIVVAPGVAFAHARPSAAVKETSLSWVRLSEPVEFHHASNDPVHLVVACAAKNSSEHVEAMKQLARLLATKRKDLDRAETEEQLRKVITSDMPAQAPRFSPSGTTSASATPSETTHETAENSVPSKGKILTVCGNGLGTSLFLKNTLEQVLDAWGWDSYLNVEATDTISAKGRASEADFLLTSGEIAATLGDVGVPVYVIADFTSTSELDGALRELYDI
ncbi:PTS transporter subunit EIIA [Corynebacterium macginleyi]|uniref:Ascorbate-specific PTS system EIIA component n=1 Tax=Corynebacterium macginleyi TaxID=38290 RepID=A0A3M0G6R4_9CORY|nr:PTS sugar transporter subunit IIA [Corynebacterium macginleyi]MBK4156812.1 PTS transporter subunit EIIA [Corynebacterium macginleyi]QRJ58513.1 PTS sugar transporter subunit IIA [Corynebacterium macginleyi]RMB60691.1 PTS sugar transporter [Corynebacterium macginleyi]